MFRRLTRRRGESSQNSQSADRAAAQAAAERRQLLIDQAEEEKTLPPWHPAHNAIERRRTVDFVSRGQGKFKCPNCPWPNDIFPELRTQFYCNDCRHFLEVVDLVKLYQRLGEPTSFCQQEVKLMLANERVDKWVDDVQGSVSSADRAQGYPFGADEDDSYFVSGPESDFRFDQPGGVTLIDFEDQAPQPDDFARTFMDLGDLPEFDGHTLRGSEDSAERRANRR